MNPPDGMVPRIPARTGTRMNGEKTHRETLWPDPGMNHDFESGRPTPKRKLRNLKRQMSRP